MLLACSSSPPAPHADAPADGFSVLEVSPAAYDATGAAGDGPALEAQCKRWSLTREQAESFFHLSRPISGEKKHSDFYTLPCNINGRARSESRTWNFSINAAATATLTSGSETRLLGCSAQECKALVLMMPEGTDQ